MYIYIHMYSIYIYVEREREKERERSSRPAASLWGGRSRAALRTCCSQQQVCWVDVPSSGGRLESYAEAAGSQLPSQVSLAKSKPEIGPVSLKWVARK